MTFFARLIGGNFCGAGVEVLPLVTDVCAVGVVTVGPAFGATR